MNGLESMVMVVVVLVGGACVVDGAMTIQLHVADILAGDVMILQLSLTRGNIMAGDINPNHPNENTDNP